MHHWKVPCFSLLIILSTSLAVASSEADNDEPSDCGPDNKQPIYIRRVFDLKKDVVLSGRGLNPDLSVIIDGRKIAASAPPGIRRDTELRFAIDSYPGEKELPARVEIKLESPDGSQQSNVCSFRYPGKAPVLFGAAMGLSNREEEPVAMALVFVGFRSGSVQNRLPRMDSKGNQMNAWQQLLRRFYVVGGRTKLAGSEGPGWTVGLAFRATEDVKFMYAARVNDSDYPRHLIGIAGTFNFTDVKRTLE